MYFRNAALTVALGLTMALPVLADDDHAKGYREHGAHVHGAGDLNVAVDGSALLVELHGPAANLVGFEHPPRNAPEEQVVADARVKLADPALTFLPNAEAGCTLTDYEVFMELAGDDGGHAHDHDHDHDQTGEVHSDAGVAYSFDCAAPEQLKSLALVLFETFPGTQRLRVQLITPDAQRGVELTAGDAALAL